MPDFYSHAEAGRRRILLGCLGAISLCAGLLPAKADYTALVDPNLVVVTHFEGWGTSLCWWGNTVGAYPNRDTYADLAFSVLKLNIVRYNIGGGENPTNHFLSYRAQMPGFEPANGVWNWNADTNQRWLLQAALARGVTRVEAFANSPPWWMTLSGSVTGNTNGNNLQTGYEQPFAAYLATVVSNLSILDGVTFDTVTPMNEPNEGWWLYGGSQEGCNMSTAQQVRVVNYLRAELDARGLAMGIAAPEDSYEQDSVNALNAYGATALNNVARIVTHTYSANVPAGLRNLAASQHKPLWVSEYGHCDASGMNLARRIHDDLTQMWARAWVYWQFVDSATCWGLLANPEVAPSNPSYTTAYTVHESFYVMGQFSQFIRPGYEILNVADTNSLAAYDPTNATLVIVTLNDSTNSFNVTYDLSAFATLPRLVTRCRTSASENQAALVPLLVSNRQFTAPAPAMSVTTHVLTNAVPAPRFLGACAWYPFEGSAQDATGNGNDGLVYGNVSFVPGKMGALAAQFDGVSSYVQIPRSLSNDFTIACWVKTTATAGGSQWWDGKGLVDGEVQGTKDDFGLALVGSVAGFGVGNPDTTLPSTGAINDGQWHHVAATRDAVSGQMQLYLDGTLQNGVIGPTGTKNSPPALRIGSIQAGYSGGFLAGALDDVQLFDRVLGPSEIAALLLPPPPLRVWGDNSWNQANAPPSLSNIVAVASGAFHNLALRSDGRVLAWGDNQGGQCATPPDLTNALAIAAGAYHSLAIRADGTLAAWGSNNLGQASVPPGLGPVIGIAAGTSHSLALRRDGTLVAWGDDSSGQTNVPPGLTNVAAIAAGGNHCLALLSNGLVLGWGANTNGSGTFTGQALIPSSVSNVLAVAAGDYHSLVVLADGTVSAWGDDSQGQCEVPPGLSNVVAVAGGGAHSLALLQNGNVAAWGANGNGQCRLPASLTNAVAIAAGEENSLVLQDNPLPPPRLVLAARNRQSFTALAQTLNRKHYALDYLTSPSSPSWTPLSTNTGHGPLALFGDLSATNAARFYRLRQW